MPDNQPISWQGEGGYDLPKREESGHFASNFPIFTEGESGHFERKKRFMISPFF